MERKMKTNKYAGTCNDCGGVVPAGKGILTSEWNNYKDDTEWVLRHADKSICSAIKADAAQEASKNNAIKTGIAWIKNNAEKSNTIQDGEQVVYDGRTGYNNVGWLLTRTGDTLYLTSRSNLDGHDMSVTYILNVSSGKIDDLLWTMQLI
jgi:hypothetical protein